MSQGRPSTAITHRYVANRCGLGLGLVFLVTFGVAQLVSAFDDVTLAVDKVEGAGWTAESVQFTLKLPSRTSADATVGRLRMPAWQQDMRNLQVRCPEVEVSATTIACARAQITADVAAVGPQSLTGRVSYGRIDGALEIELAGLRIGKGAIRLAASMRDEGWHVRADLERVEVGAALALARQSKVPVPDFSFQSGTMSGSFAASGAGASLAHARGDVRLADVTANNEAGTLASEKLSFAIKVEASDRGGDLKFAGTFQSSQGQAYAQPIFLDFGAHGMDVQASGTWPRTGPIVIDRFAVLHQGVARGQGAAAIDIDHDQPLRTLRFDLQSLQFPGAYESYFQPLLLDTNFKALRTEGAIAGTLVLEEGSARRIDLEFADVTLDDGARNFVLNGLSGDWHWTDSPARTDDDDEETAVVPTTAADSALGWRSGVLLNLDLGASVLRFNTHGRQFRLLEPTSIPLVDGAIDLESLRIRNAGLPTVAFMVDAAIQPISVQRLCQAFGWPEFGGRIAGQISKLRMREGIVTLGATLQAQVFDGEVRLSDLRLEEPFGKWPRFQSNISLHNLDLNLVTSAFSFGSITGRLSGEINGLQLFNWQPTAFDARLYTPPDDRSRHRISQRAVQNIGSIGGGGAGVTAALSGGVMRLFDEFNYDRLGISCRLENEVCHVEGIAPAPNGGYYLVKGKGLPRIDVIGGARRVDWPRLVQQLIAVTESEGPVVD